MLVPILSNDRANTVFLYVNGELVPTLACRTTLLILLPAPSMARGELKPTFPISCTYQIALDEVTGRYRKFETHNLSFDNLVSMGDSRASRAIGSNERAATARPYRSKKQRP